MFIIIISSIKNSESRSLIEADQPIHGLMSAGLVPTIEKSLN